MMFAIVVNYGYFFLHLKITCIKASTGPYMAIPWFIKICIFFPWVYKLFLLLHRCFQCTQSKSPRDRLVSSGGKKNKGPALGYFGLPPN